ncbi:MAG: hypothetical protein CVV41_18545 [Candidatus Riflebacteria bacterium HGW-Riflebacteria-1]|jgi:hypothetical protein|nr:MAG: hypothetical protein CVV41_18545 [Candidatus Riflebacteria bacterium HGW-Riflebacteria-1]
MKRKPEENPPISPISADKTKRQDGVALKKRNARGENPQIAPTCAERAEIVQVKSTFNNGIQSICL